MNLPQQIKPVAELQPGDVLAEAVCDQGGNVLLPAGASLGESAIAGLERRGIEQVSVRVVIDEAAREARREAVKARLAYLFRHAGDGAAARTLQHAVLEYRLKEPT